MTDPQTNPDRCGEITAEGKRVWRAVEAVDRLLQERLDKPPTTETITFAAEMATAAILAWRDDEAG